MNKSKIRVVYVCNLRNTFTRIDEEILSQEFDVTSLYLQKRNPAFLPNMWKAIYQADVVVAWFASWHSLPAFLSASFLNKPRILITGGYDVANVPEIDYGLRRGGIPQLLTDIVFRLSTRAIPFSDNAYREALANTSLNTGSLDVVHLGVPDTTICSDYTQKEAIAITIAGINAISVRRKGVEEFINAARLMPDVRFLVVGKHYDNTIEHLRTIASDNVEFPGFLSDTELAALLCQSSVYVQASYHEGFGLAVAEAMLAGCIPIVSRRGSLPEIVGDTGLFIEAIEPEQIANKVSDALKMSPIKRELARQHILDNFSIERRAIKLQGIVKQLVNREG